MEAILIAASEKEQRYNKFMAAINGVDLDKAQSNHQERFDAVQRRAQAKLSGASEEEIEMGALGLDIEIEE